VVVPGAYGVVVGVEPGPDGSTLIRVDLGGPHGLYPPSQVRLEEEEEET
jgi:hypothetical protein